MHISVVASRKDVENKKLYNRNVVVIDVLRATSVIVTALANGAKTIIPVESVEEAWTLYKKYDSEDIILCGERNALDIEGFHLGNSPLSYIRENISDKLIIQTTSNGSKTIKACTEGNKVYIGSFLNIQAVVRQLIKDCLDTVIVCSGTDSEFSMDDALCAGMIISLLEQKKEISLTDLSWAVKNIYNNNKYDIHSFLSQSCAHYRLLRNNGFEEDLDYCLEVNKFDILPIYSKGMIKIDEEL